MNQSQVGALAVITAALLWSLDGFLRQSLYSLPPSVVIFWEHMFGLIILLPVIVFSFRQFRSISRQQWSAIVLVSFLSGALGTVLYTAALTSIQFIAFSVVVLLQQLQPIFAITAAAVLLRERLTVKFLSLTVIAIGAAYLISFPELRIAGGNATAALLALGAAASWGISTAFSKYALQKTSFLHIVTARFALTPLFALLFVATLGQSSSLLALTGDQWKTIAAITISTGAVALGIYYYGLKRIEASHSTILELTWPLSAALVGYLFLGDRLTTTQWIGAVVLVATMWLVARDSRKPSSDGSAISARNYNEN